MIYRVVYEVTALVIAENEKDALGKVMDDDIEMSIHDDKSCELLSEDDDDLDLYVDEFYY